MTEEDSKEDEPEKIPAPEAVDEDDGDGDDNDDSTVSVDTEKGEKQKDEVAEPKKEKVNVLDTVDWEISCILPCSEKDVDLLVAIKCPDHDSFTIPCYYSWKLEGNEIVGFNPTHLEQDHVNNMSYSQSKQFLLLSTQQSMVQVRDVLDAEHFVNIRIHSSWQHTGNLMAMTFDDRMLVTSSTDGSVFCHLFDPNKLKHPSFDEHFDVDYISMKEDEQQQASPMAVTADAADMTEKDYSVQGEKIQRELDNAKSAAEAHKARLRAELDAIRSKKSEILSKTKDAMRHDLGLSISDLDIDKNLRSKMSDKLENDVTFLLENMCSILETFP